MAALVRHDTAIEAVFPRVAAGIQADATEIGRLNDALDCVKESDNPRTAHLLACSRTKIAQKLIEEAGETALAAVRHRSRSVVRESADLLYHLADLLYHLIVLWHECGITPDEVWAEMRSRADKLGIAEKLPKWPGRHASAPQCGE
jgi:phosphoribosyl-ATP pyrophosphohydrolase